MPSRGPRNRRQNQEETPSDPKVKGAGRVGGTRAKPVIYKQDKLKAGLLVTEELDKAIADCKARVARISKECRAHNRKFRDAEFDLENDRWNTLHGLNAPETPYSPSDIQRISQLFSKPSFFGTGESARANDIHQGALGDCWFLSALATISGMKGLVEKLCVARDELVGVYGFIFFRETTWVPVIIDDLLFTSIPKWEELSITEKSLYHDRKEHYDALARKGGRGLYFARCGGEEGAKETWVPLIEKAYAKLHGDYQSLNGGFCGEALEDLTGGVSTIVRVKDILDTEQFWHEELVKANQDRLFGCSLTFTSSARNNNAYLYQHGPRWESCLLLAGKRFVVLRNPWGDTNSEWNGKWSDGDEAWTLEWLQRLPEIGHAFGRHDGQFVMEYCDFLTTWDDIDRTLVFDSSYVMSSQMLQVDVRPLPSCYTYGDVSFTIEIPEKSPAVIVLSRLDERYFTDLAVRSAWHFDLSLFKAGEPEPIIESVHGTYRGVMRSINFEVDLEPGEYVVHVRIGRNYTAGANWYAEGFAKWNDRKLSKVLTERAKSRALAANFQPSKEYNNLPVPLEAIGGKSLAELTLNAKGATYRRQLFEKMRGAALAAALEAQEGGGAEEEAEEEAGDGEADWRGSCR
ncbi:hypothetical protein DL96DRAFT_1771293 [Flagelloscypha sp. PMI_526]|nr:hypothetical protein DL96DRAFT_1771293 [Flagelloscypha sp. PMI_526]